MATLKGNLTTQILSKEIIDKNKTALDLVSYYSRVSEIVQRTRIAMGKKNSFKIESSSTKNQKLNTNAYGATH
jgi:hypothetical protein